MSGSAHVTHGYTNTLAIASIRSGGYFNRKFRQGDLKMKRRYEAEGAKEYKETKQEDLEGSEESKERLVRCSLLA